MEEIVNISKKGRYLWVTLPDSLNLESNRSIEQQIEAQLSEEHNHIVIDFSDTTALYSSGLGLLIRLRKMAMDMGGSVCLINVCSTVRHLLLVLNLDRVFHIYATEVEFELSEDDIWKTKIAQNTLQFLFVSEMEKDFCRIVISGKMIVGRDYSLCASFSPDPNISIYVFDLSSLELIDSTGYRALCSITESIRRSGGECRAFGASDLIQELLVLLGADKIFEFFSDESKVFEQIAG